MKIFIINDWKYIDTMPLFEFRFDICNIALIGLYIDLFKVNISIIGFCFSFWYRIQKDKE